MSKITDQKCQTNSKCLRPSIFRHGTTLEMKKKKVKWKIYSSDGPVAKAYFQSRRRNSQQATFANMHMAFLTTNSRNFCRGLRSLLRKLDASIVSFFRSIRKSVSFQLSVSTISTTRQYRNCNNQNDFSACLGCALYRGVNQVGRQPRQIYSHVKALLTRKISHNTAHDAEEWEFRRNSVRKYT